MKAVRMVVDRVSIEVEAGATVIEAARRAGISVPSLCWHPALKPAGACKACAVEIVAPEGPRVRLACLLRVREGLTVLTRSPLAQEAQTQALAELMRLAPQSRRIQELALAHGLELPSAPDGCLRCRLCVRVCGEVVGASALVMERRGGRRYVVAREDRCIGCGTCANLCPTGAIRMTDEGGIRTIAIREEIIGRHALTPCETCGRLFATHKFLARVSERAQAEHPDVKEHHHRCPTCAKLFSPRITSSRGLRMR
ncbi:MAG: 2Fe-2S iron-sulfur cluster-binding protein [Thermodesulfobacteriota bacterium]